MHFFVKIWSFAASSHCESKESLSRGVNAKSHISSTCLKAFRNDLLLKFLARTRVPTGTAEKQEEALRMDIMCTVSLQKMPRCHTVPASRAYIGTPSRTLRGHGTS